MVKDNETIGRFPPCFYKGDNVYDFQITVLHTKAPSKKESILKWKNLFPSREISLLLGKITFQKETKTILTELSTLKMYDASLNYVRVTKGLRPVVKN